MDRKRVAVLALIGLGAVAAVAIYFMLSRISDGSDAGGGGGPWLPTLVTWRASDVPLNAPPSDASRLLAMLGPDGCTLQVLDVDSALCYSAYACTGAKSWTVGTSASPPSIGLGDTFTDAVFASGNAMVAGSDGSLWISSNGSCGAWMSISAPWPAGLIGASLYAFDVLVTQRTLVMFAGGNEPASPSCNFMLYYGYAGRTGVTTWHSVQLPELAPGCNARLASDGNVLTLVAGSGSYQASFGVPLVFGDSTPSTGPVHASVVFLPVPAEGGAFMSVGANFLASDTLTQAYSVANTDLTVWADRYQPAPYDPLYNQQLIALASGSFVILGGYSASAVVSSRVWIGSPEVLSSPTALPTLTAQPSASMSPAPPSASPSATPSSSLNVSASSTPSATASGSATPSSSLNVSASSTPSATASGSANASAAASIPPPAPACPSGRWGPQCDLCPGAASGPACSGHGSCDGDGTHGGAGTCRCSIGYAGAECEVFVGAIAGGCAGALVFLGVAYVLWRRRRSRTHVPPHDAAAFVFVPLPEGDLEPPSLWPSSTPFSGQPSINVASAPDGGPPPMPVYTRSSAGGAARNLQPPLETSWGYHGSNNPTV